MSYRQLGFELTPQTRTISSGTNNPSAGQSARALAISSALNAPPVANPAAVATKSAFSRPPPRAESPQIPSGGVDVLAARATRDMHTRAVEMEVDVSDGAYGGFASARGVKRGSDEGLTSG